MSKRCVESEVIFGPRDMYEVERIPEVKGMTDVCGVKGRASCKVKGLSRTGACRRIGEGGTGCPFGGPFWPPVY